MPDYISKMKPNGATGPEYNIKDAEAREVLSGLVEDLQEIDTPDNEPFLYRSLKGGGDRVYLNELVGGSVAWNQLVQNGDLINTFSKSDVTFTKVTNGFELSGTASATSNNSNVTGGKSYIQNHIYYMYDGLGKIALWDGYHTNENVNGYIFKWDRANGVSYTYVRIVTGTSYSGTIKPQIFDLTLMFGSTIADYIYSLEQAESGSGIAWIKSYGFFTKDYYPYDAGSIKSVETSGKKYVGKNRFDKSNVQKGSLDSSGNVYLNSSDTRRVSDYIEIEPNTVYYLSNAIDLVNGRTGFWYDENKTAISQITFPSTVQKSGAITSPNNAKYAIICVPSETLDIAQLEKGSTATSYEPYKSAYYNIYDTELRGIPTLQSNKLVYDGDIYSNDGILTRKYGVVDLGTLEWTYANNNTIYSEHITNAKAGIDGAKGNIINSKYNIASFNSIYLRQFDKTLALNSSRRVYVYDTAYTDAATFKTSMSGVYLVYELATTTTSQLLPFQSPQIVFKDGTEEFIDDREVPIPVGHNSVYTDIPDFMESGYLAETRDNADTARHDLNALGLTIQNGKICQVYLKET